MADDDELVTYRRFRHSISTIWDVLGDNNLTASEITPAVVENIFAVIGDEFTTPNIEAERDIYNQAVQCYTKVLHVLVSHDPIQCKVDCPTIVKRLLDIINTRSSSSNKHSLDLLIAVLDSIASIISDDDSLVLQAIFVGVSCFQYLVAALAAKTNDDEEQNRLFVSCIKATSIVTYGSSASKEVFKATVGYDKLCSQLKTLKNPSETFTFALLDWAVEGSYQDNEVYMNNADVMLLILEWLPAINGPAQRFAAYHVKRLCQVSIRNAMLCSVNGMFGKIVATLDSHQLIDEQVAVTLIEALEELGSFSVGALELKQLISLFRPLEDGSHVKFSHHLLQALLIVSCSRSKKRAQYCFDLHNKLSGITLPIIQKWMGSSFTFFTWLCIEPEPNQTKKHTTEERKNYRRVIYSFFNNSGIGVEAFVSKDKDLVIATYGKRECHTVRVPDCGLLDGQWGMTRGRKWETITPKLKGSISKHSLSIAHLPSRRPFGQSALLVCIDGVTKTMCSLKFHSLASEELSSCHIACGSNHSTSQCHMTSSPSAKSVRFAFRKASSVDSPIPGHSSLIAAGTEDNMWGAPTTLQGLLGPICIFNEGLVEFYHKTWHNAGPNNVDVFQPPDMSGTSQGSLFEVSSKLVLYYHAKAVRDFVCFDLTPPQPTHTDLPGRLSGHQCITWNIKDVIDGIGGVQIFLPLLEGIRYSHDKPCGTNPSVETAGPKLDQQDENSLTEDWELVKEPTDIHDLRQDMAVICKKTQVSLFLYLILNVLKEGESSLSSFNDHSILFISHMLQTCDSRLLDMDVLKAIQDMMECINSPCMLDAIYQYLVFNFDIWSFCACHVRVGHIQFVSTVIKDNPTFFKKSFGVQFLLDVINMYYAGEHVCNTTESKRAGAFDITDEDTKMLRASLLGLVKFYLIGKPTVPEARCLVEYLQNVRDPGQVVEIMDIINSLCTRNSTNKLVKRLSEPNNVCVFVFILQNFLNEPIRLKVLKLMAAILSSSIVPEANKDSWRLKGIGVTPLTDVLCSDATISMILGLLELSVTELSEVKGIQVYGHYDVVLAVVKMVLDKDLETKLLVSHMILTSLDASSSSVEFLCREPGWYVYILKLLTVKSRDQIPTDPESVEAKHMEDLVQSVLTVVLKGMWRGVPGHDEQAWKNRGQVITSVSTIASSEIFLYPSRVIERRLLEMSLQEVGEGIQQSGQTGESETKNSLMIMRLVEDFIFTSVTGQESEDDYKCSVKLVDCVSHLLEALNVWGKDDMEDDVEWGEMAQIGGRILLGFIAHKDTNFCATASSKLSKLLKVRTITSQVEVCFILGKLYEAFIDSRQQDGSSNFTFIVPIIRLVILKYHNQLPLTIYIPSLNARDRNKFDEEIVMLIESDEFKAMMRQQIVPAMRQYANQCYDSSLVSGRFWMECLNGLKESLEKQASALESSSILYSKRIIHTAAQIADQQQQHNKNLITQKTQHQVRVASQWVVTKRKFSSDRAVWASRCPQETHWKLSTMETFQRMRLKLCQSYNFTNHSDASATRDNMESRSGNRLRTSVHVQVAQEAMIHGSVDSMDEDDLIIPSGSSSPPSSPRSKSIPVPEKVLIEVDSEFITLMDRVPGKLKVSTTHVYFTANRNRELTATIQDFAWALTELREVHLRRYSLRKTALEFFLVDQTNYFINSSKDDRNLIYKSIMTLRPPNLYYIGARTPVQLLKASGLTERWMRREMSNFEYVMQLNTIAGRSYNDLSQYPVFPWILTDYTSDKLDLNNPAVYRDLSKPVGALNPERAEDVREKYDSFVDPSGEFPKFHYGTHYSNSAGVLYYMLRVEPFTTLHINLQNNRFDHADRQFHNIPLHWNSIYYKSSDVKELIPEFFCFPDFLENSNGFDLGRLQNGQPVGDVILPQWAKSPHDFVHKHRMALESEFVSMNLHNWIDLIFGYKQRGKPAEEALNVFSFYTYEGAIDLDAITDPHRRLSTEGMINDFGQTPTQLLTTPHPQRITQQEAAAHKAQALEITGSTRVLDSVFDFFDKLKAYYVEVSDVRDPLVYTAVPCVQARNLIHHGMPDTMVTISRKGVLGAQDWLPYSKTKSRPFTFELDPSLTSSRLRRIVAAPFVPDLTISSKLFAISNDARIVVTGGHWDSTIRVFTCKGKLISRIKAHSDVVTCLVVDNDGRHLITGSRDTTCRVWSVTQVGGWAADVSKTPLQTLYGHDHEITCVAMSWELDMAVSGAADGTCIIYTARKGEYLRTLRPLGNEQVSCPGLYRVSSIALSEYGNIVLYCYGRDNSALCRYSINGQLLADERTHLKDDVTDMTVYGEYIVTGGNAGRLSIRDLHSFQEVKCIKLRTSITSVSLATDNSHIFATLIDGKLIVIGVDFT